MDANFDGNDMKNLVNFTGALKNFKICTLRNLLLSKVYNAWYKKLQSYVSWDRRVIQYLRKNWLVIWKMI